MLMVRLLYSELLTGYVNYTILQLWLIICSCIMQRKVDGYIKDQRIYCNHCNRVVRSFLIYDI